jgi:3-methylcrotonyl-CoA carboxylase alpha subunit
MFSSVLIANRGEIAVRVIKTARALAMRTIAVYPPSDRDALHVRLADEAHELRPHLAPKGYLDIAGIIAMALRAGAECIHPGYGFLAENPLFAEACEWSGVPFVGPPHEAIALLGQKHEAKALMARIGAPVIPGYAGADQSPKMLADEAARLGYPVMIKAIAGGGGKGLRAVTRPREFDEALASAQREAWNAFGDDRVLLEKLIQRPRHIEVQIFADSHGEVVHLFERDCSLQRRHQKVIEEAPAPGMPDGLRDRMTRTAAQAARAAGYVGAGTVEFLTESDRLSDTTPFYFLEMNTRLQVEHPVTELIAGVDLVEWQFRVAAGEALPLTQDEIGMSGAAIEARIYAEDPANGFLPSAGRLHALRLPEVEGVRVDAGVFEGGAVTADYDPLIAKLIAYGDTRDEALRRLKAALRGTVVAGPQCNISFLHRLVSHVSVSGGGVDTGFLDDAAEGLARREPNPMAPFAGAKALLEGSQRRIEARRQDFSSERHSPWSATDNFALGPSRTLSLDLLADDAPQTVALTWKDGQLEPPEDDGVSALFAAAKVFDASEDSVANGPDAEDAVIVWSALSQTIVRRRPVSLDVHEIFDRADMVCAPLHGRIVKVYVTEGQHVHKGDRLAVIEAMKMEHILHARADGVVRDLSALEGAQCSQGAAIARIEREKNGKISDDPGILSRKAPNGSSQSL